MLNKQNRRSNYNLHDTQVATTICMTHKAQLLFTIPDKEPILGSITFFFCQIVRRLPLNNEYNVITTQ
jgi:hypothetical protein